MPYAHSRRPSLVDSADSKSLRAYPPTALRTFYKKMVNLRLAVKATYDPDCSDGWTVM